ncbi:MAG: GNAT family N-acetyltransferase [Bacteroidia bacterium]
MTSKKSIHLKPFKKEHVVLLQTWADTEEELVQFAGPVFKFPLTEEQVAHYLEDQNRAVFLVEEAQNKVAIGMGEIFIVNAETRRLCRITVGNKQYRGKGFGQAIITTLLEKSFSDKAVNTVELNVFEFNTTAIKCYTACGFTITPNNIRIIDVNTQKWNLLNMKISREKYFFEA